MVKLLMRCAHGLLLFSQSTSSFILFQCKSHAETHGFRFQVSKVFFEAFGTSIREYEAISVHKACIKTTAAINSTDNARTGETTGLNRSSSFFSNNGRVPRTRAQCYWSFSW